MENNVSLQCIQVILPKGSNQEELELYPITLKLLRHQNQTTRLPQQPNTWSGMVGGYGAAALSKLYFYCTVLNSTGKIYLIIDLKKNRFFRL